MFICCVFCSTGLLGNSGKCFFFPLSVLAALGDLQDCLLEQELELRPWQRKPGILTTQAIGNSLTPFSILINSVITTLLTLPYLKFPPVFLFLGLLIDICWEFLNQISLFNSSLIIFTLSRLLWAVYYVNPSVPVFDSEIISLTLSRPRLPTYGREVEGGHVWNACKN